MAVQGYLMGLPTDPQAAPVTNSYRWATVTVASPLAIQMDGDTLPLATVPDCLCDPLTLAPGDRVWTQIYGRKVIVHGGQGGGSAGRLNEVTSWLVPSNIASSASGSYINWPSAYGGPLTATLVKQQAGTDVVVSLSVGGLVQTAAGIVDFGVSVDGGAATQIIRTAWNVANSHVGWTASKVWSGLTAASHSFTLQMKSVSGLTVVYDTNDTFSMTVREVV